MIKMILASFLGSQILCVFRVLTYIIFLYLALNYQQKGQMSDLVDIAVLKRYEVIKKVGEGAYGQVWKAKEKRSKETVALKKLYDAFRNQTDAQRTYREIMFMQLLDHPNIVKLLSCIRPSNDSDIYITMQYMQTDLSTVLKTGVLKDLHKQYIFAQVVAAVAYMHSGDLIHRDLKPANILLNTKCEAKVCDFGLVKTFQERSVMTQNVATRWYRAPQMLLGSQKYNKKVDSWSLGCILGEILTGRPILRGVSTLNQIQKIMQLIGTPSLQDFKDCFSDDDQIIELYSALPMVKKRPLKESFPNADFITLDLLQRLLQFNPRKRLSIQELQNHPLVRKYSGKVSLDKASSPFKIPNDRERLDVHKYRELIYEEIQSGSRQSQTSTNFSREIKQARESTLPLMRNLASGQGKPYPKIQRGNSSSLLHKLKSRSQDKMSFFAHKAHPSVLNQQNNTKGHSKDHSEFGSVSVKSRENSQVKSKRYDKYQIYNIKDQAKRQSIDLQIRCSLYEQYNPKKKPVDEHNSSFITKVRDNLKVTPPKKNQTQQSVDKNKIHKKAASILNGQGKEMKKMKQSDLELTNESVQIRKGTGNYHPKIQRSRSKNHYVFSKNLNSNSSSSHALSNLNNIGVSSEKSILDEFGKQKPTKYEHQSQTPVLDKFQVYVPQCKKINQPFKIFQQKQSTKGSLYSNQSVQNPESKWHSPSNSYSSSKNNFFANYVSPKYAAHYKTKI